MQARTVSRVRLSGQVTRRAAELRRHIRLLIPPWTMNSALMRGRRITFASMKTLLPHRATGEVTFITLEVAVFC